MSHRWSCRNRHPAEIRPGVEPVPRRARVSPRSLPGLRSRRRLRRGAWAFGLERVNRPRRGGAGAGVTPGRTQRDLRRLRGEESSGFLERRPSQPDQPRGSFLHPVAPRASPGPRTAPCPGSRPCLSLPGSAPSPRPTRVSLSATPISYSASHNARRPPRLQLTCPPGHVARPPARWECRPRTPLPPAPRSAEPPRPLVPAPLCLAPTLASVARFKF